MTDPETINRRLHKVMGLCWHEWESYCVEGGNDCNHTYICSRCKSGSTTPMEPIDFFTWQGFGILWEWLQEHEILGDFISRYNQHPYGSNYECVDYKLVSPLALAKAVVGFFEGNREDR